MSLPTIKKPAPAFSATVVENGDFKDISLSDYLGKWVILLFYPMDFTFVCPTEILAFNDALPAFDAINTTVLGVSCDSKYAHFAWATTPRSQGGLGPDPKKPGGPLKIALVDDKSQKVSRAYGALIEDEGVPLRASYLIDPKGILRQMTINDSPVGRSVDEALRLVKAFQYTDEHGEVCPVNWSEGSRTIKGDPVGKLEFFSNGTTEKANGVKRARVE
ncbi:thioredoxin-like protein [Amylostereum chailletii]|nr:thioredoxin-like protein [Amylostereum chailletii]